MNVQENLAEIKKNINHACSLSNRDPKEITIIAVTKYVSVERAKEALTNGVIHLGENRDDGLLHKYEQLEGQPIWHFIGSLQSRKVKNIIDKVDYIHSLDRLSLAKEIHNRSNKKVKCFVQVNTSGEESKHGLKPDETIPFIQELKKYENISVIGLMTMAPNTDDEEVIRQTFRRLRNLRNEIQLLALPHAPCQDLSMGMSNDYEIAIGEGATFIRIGSSLVGNESGGVTQ
ncbi:YggS family pyridoxal phosphate-dependent enzyme [Metabacillus arenae]|uniref:Pyridoxal phosphate homeostasis protein n=1 Tax=Metabacillus arenae TaxID=2771434 RepID=A0A926NKZ1_9BACI|nr:YggS family pyridoxal phosphate-dependent enzyme [Metabacillus arenae]MBD1379947.1 YggS family pyridoxal phosphate-dependent enzyme [Metabacillus arenae]